MTSSDASFFAESSWAEPLQRPASITIVGAMGRMGRLLSRFFVEAGYEVLAVDRADAECHWRAVAESEVVILAVPVGAIDLVLEELGPLTREDGVVIDIASVKEAPLHSMLRHCRGEVIGSHPLFGPNTVSLKDQVFFVCPGRGDRYLRWFNGFLQDSGAKVVEIEPRAHDQLMAVIQCLRHTLIFCFGKTLMDLRFDLASNLGHSGPWFSELVRLLVNQLEQDPSLYVDLALHNPASSEVFDVFAGAAANLTDMFKNGDRAGLVRTIQAVSDHVLSSLTQEVGNTRR